MGRNRITIINGYTESCKKLPHTDTHHKKLRKQQSFIVVEAMTVDYVFSAEAYPKLNEKQKVHFFSGISINIFCLLDLMIDYAL